MTALTPLPGDRFQHHVAFDNVPIGEATKHNTPGVTLSVKHKGYQARRRSRTFMVGVDENNYSDYALKWLLEELVDDGDEVICVRVIEKDVRPNDKQYLEDASATMQEIVARTGNGRAISVVLEYAIGKLHNTFQRLILMYEPAMLIVGTRGRSLGGIQGLVGNRNSFSKYCLQYSPVPVIIVRPTEKRIKKKTKRANDATRKTYVAMLASSHGVHEADMDATTAYDLETKISPDEEAHQVAKVLGLPAAFDPTIRPYQSSRAKSPGASLSVANSPESRSNLTPSSSHIGADSDSDSDEEDGEFEAVPGNEALEEKEKLAHLHKMEAGEAAALKNHIDKGSDSDEDDEDTDSPLETPQDESGNPQETKLTAAE
jgi:nucleotide-binding universal stress UspA family protein